MTEREQTVRLRATLVVEYDAHPDDYGTSDPVEMAKIDDANWQADPGGLASWFAYGANECSVTVEYVGEGE